MAVAVLQPSLRYEFVSMLQYLVVVRLGIRLHLAGEANNQQYLS